MIMQVSLLTSPEDHIINSLSIVEVGFVLPRYEINNESVRMKTEELLHSDYFTVSWLSWKMMENVSTFMIENKLSFRDFNDWIIAYDVHSRNVPLVTFDKILQKKCKSLVFKLLRYNLTNGPVGI